jgi:hypothetical protein
MIAEAPGPQGRPTTAPYGHGGAEMFASTGPTIFDEIRQIGSGDYQYYRLPDGTIDLGQIGKRRSYETNLMRSGWKPFGGPHAAVMGMADYGAFAIDEYYLGRPHEVLFMRGGAHEMPAEQVIALGYHLRPPLIPRCGLQVGAPHKAASGARLHLPICWKGAQRVQFPQLAGLVAADPGSCPFCDRGDFATARARNQHVRVLHKDEMQQMSLADAIVKGVQAASSTAPATEAPLDAAASEAAEAARLAAEKAAIDEKMAAMGLIDDDAELLAASEADGEAEGEAAPKRSHKKKAS